MMLFLFTLLGHAQPKAYFPAGSFLRGSGRTPDDTPRHEVQLTAFAIDLHEVSIQEFEQFVQQAWKQDQYWSPEGLKWRKLNPDGASENSRKANRNSR